jgi:hypothetical protein
LRAARRLRRARPHRACAQFVSHAQSCCFFKLVEAIELHIALHKLDPARVCLWIDIFCACCTSALPCWLPAADAR